MRKLFFAICILYKYYYNTKYVHRNNIYIKVQYSDKVLSLGTFTKQQDIISVLVQNTFGVRAQ